MSGVTDVLQETLRTLMERRRKLEPFVAELGEIDIAEKDLRKSLAKISKRPSASRAPSVAPVSDDANQSKAEGGTYRERIVAVLREYPQGLSAARIGALSGIAGNSVYPTLTTMATGPSAVLDKVGRGFYRLTTDAAGEQVDAELSDEDREALGDRAAA